MLNRFIITKLVFAAFLLCVATVIASPAQTFKTLLRFNRTDGANPPYMTLVLGSDGNFYGTASVGGANDSCDYGLGCGTVFEITPAGNLTTLYSFCSQKNCTDGNFPQAGLVQATNGNFYGTTAEGGALGYGTVFEITPAGESTTLYSFDSSDGAYPWGALVQAPNGRFYGTTFGGGTRGYGTVFEITAAGKLTTVHSFAGYPTDGESPTAGLVQANGIFYGTTFNGGTNNGGTVFEITPKGKLTILYSFCSKTSCTDGAYPYGAGLVHASDGNFYGTTYGGGAAAEGTVFKITPKGKLTTLYSFCSQENCTDGSYPEAGLVQAINGNFYGTTVSGGVNGNYGTVFEITPKGKLTTVHSFCSKKGCPDGAVTFGGLVQTNDGIFYGTTFTGGTDGWGTVFSLSAGLGPQEYRSFPRRKGYGRRTARAIQRHQFHKGIRFRGLETLD
jgi:uncharacterized repeat protein (TIGR03803 family)